jgi:hypothetical protein
MKSGPGTAVCRLVSGQVPGRPMIGSGGGAYAPKQVRLEAYAGWSASHFKRWSGDGRCGMGAGCKYRRGMYQGSAYQCYVYKCGMSRQHVPVRYVHVPVRYVSVRT